MIALLLMTFSVNGQTDSAKSIVDSIFVKKFFHDDFYPYIVYKKSEPAVMLRGRIGNDWVKIYWRRSDGDIKIEYDEKDKADN